MRENRNSNFTITSSLCGLRFTPQNSFANFGPATQRLCTHTSTATETMSELVREEFSVWAATPAQIPLKPKVKSISIRNPQYDKINTFLHLPALDFDQNTQFEAATNAPLHTPNDLAKYNKVAGLHRGTITMACYALAGNKYGVLSPCRLANKADIESQLAEVHSSPTGFDEVLNMPHYYFYTVDFFETSGYDVITNFPDWTFPTAEELELNPVYQLWLNAYTEIQDRMLERDLELKSQVHCAPSDISTHVKTRDVVCRLTRCHDPLDAAHLVPEKEKIFWERSEFNMLSKNSAISSDSTAVAENMIALRKDVHHIFDQRAFCITLKGNTFVASFCTLDYCDSLRAFQNRPILEIATAALPYILTRFIWTFFGHSLLLYARQHPKKNRARGSEDGKGKGKGKRFAPDDTEESEEDLGGPSGQPWAKKGRKVGPEGIRKSTRQIEKSAEDNFTERIERIRKIGQAIKSDFPPGFFDADMSSLPELSLSQRALADVTSFYPGCENAEILSEDYKKRHPQVHSLAKPQGPWMEEDEFDLIP
ncbi:hypothetical protein DRE_00946 [Drechslerella stenobrocha 248]|uniref:HNH nuclease domain-containing protein n=1 Tax=Drechslerella stenobrocha 248 TaxID=1043628 RepID=W7HXN0_9PEZI|nr:hypothetical protein DRE_00946 [Drechslerella stenobrocha 248]